MITLEHKDLQLSNQAPIKCLANMNFPSNLKFNGSNIQDFQEVKDKIYCHPTQEAVEPDGDSVKTSEETQRGAIYQHGLGICPTFYPGSGDVKLSNLKAVKGQFYSYSGDNQFHYAPVLRIPQNYLNEYNFQDFHYFVVIDFEATCDKEKVPNPQEIIEFPSVIVNGMTGQLEACFQTYVRPTCNRILSDFCKDLTGIQQIQVDRGVALSEALLRHDKWLEKKGVKDKNFAVVTWSSWDCRVMLESECRYKKIRKPSYFNRWINLRVPFREIFGGARCNLKEAVEMTGLAWQGRAHCGLDDAKNTACLLAKLMSRGFRFSITDTMVSDPAADDSFPSKQPTEFAFTPHFPSLRLMAMHLPAAFQFEPHCFCGVKSSKGMVRKPGPKQGCMFYGCGNWTAAMGARCHFFHWVSP